MADEYDEFSFVKKDPRDSARTRTRTLVFDMAELGDPVLAKEYYAPIFASDHNLYVNGRYMSQGNVEAGLRIVDVGDPLNPKEVGYLANIGWAWGTYPFLKNSVIAVSTTAGLALVRLHKG